jgi:hypothetical protein
MAGKLAVRRSHFGEFDTNPKLHVRRRSAGNAGRFAPGSTARRARQNVAFKFGYFVVLLRSERMVALVVGDVDMPSELEALVYKPMNPSDHEGRIAGAREMKAV